jgi:hypothetical protein
MNATMKMNENQQSSDERELRFIFSLRVIINKGEGESSLDYQVPVLMVSLDWTEVKARQAERPLRKHLLDRAMNDP